LEYKYESNKDSEGVEGMREPEKQYTGKIFVKMFNCRKLKNEATFKVFGTKSDPFVEYSISNN